MALVQLYAFMPSPPSGTPPSGEAEATRRIMYSWTHFGDHICDHKLFVTTFVVTNDLWPFVATNVAIMWSYDHKMWSYGHIL